MASSKLLCLEWHFRSFRIWNDVLEASKSGMMPSKLPSGRFKLNIKMNFEFEFFRIAKADSSDIQGMSLRTDDFKEKVFEQSGVWQSELEPSICKTLITNNWMV